MAPLLAAAIPALIDAVPDVIGWFAGDKAEDAAKDVLDVAKKVTGTDTDEEALKAIKQDPLQARLLREAIMKDKHVKDKLYLEDRQNARAMQTEALKQGDMFSKRFIYYFALMWSIFSFGFIIGITFFEIPEQNIRFADTVLGVLLGTIISGILQFFYGSSQSSKEKTQMQMELTKKLKP